ncbi:MAG: patatin-like phospholipase family protein [Hyphomonadaceae bacterium]
MFQFMGIELVPSLKTIPFLKDAPARALRAAGKEAKWFSLKAGSPLFEAGESADSIFFVLSGTLGAFRPRENGAMDFLGHVRAGEPVGEMALFSGGREHSSEPHSNSVYAMRDTELMSISRAGFDRLIKAEPEILERLIRVILLRLRQSGRRSARAEPKVFTMVATSPTIDVDARAETLKSTLNGMGLRATVVKREEGEDKSATYFDHLEKNNDIVILTAELGEDGWYKQAVRQADRIWILGRADAVPSDPILERDNSPARQFKLVDVILLHGKRQGLVATPGQWLSATGGERIFHWTGQKGDDCERLARIMSGRSVGVVFSGGGARAFSHIGVIRAIRERNIPIDFAGGTSMGAVIAACVAMGWDDAEIEYRIRKGFVETNPLGDYNLPVVGLVRGRRVDKRLKEHFGDALIGDLEIPYYCVSTNLTDGDSRIHRRGFVRHALRSSIALPGILPPVIDDGDVLVDGGVLNNFPVDVMQGLHRGLNIGSDVTRQRHGFPADEFIEPPGFFRWALHNGLRRTPPIASLLMRAATVGVNPRANREHAHICVIPDISKLELRDWDSYEAAVEAGYRSAVETLDTSERVLSENALNKVIVAG